MPTVTFRGTSADVNRLMTRLVRVISGYEPDPWGVAQEVQLAIGVKTLELIRAAFDVKAAGGRADDGLQWAPLAPSTIARRRKGPADVRAVRLKARAPNLNPRQKRELEGRIRQRTAELLQRGLTQSQARGLARAQAEQAARRQGLGVATIRGVLGGREVLIERDTSRLYASLSPGVSGRPSGAADQVFRMNPGEVIVGSNVPYVRAQHRGIPGRLPARPFWPEHLPEAWLKEIRGTLSRSIARVFARLLERGITA